MSYDVLPDVRPYQAKRTDRPLATSKIADHDPRQAAQITPPVQAATSAQTPQVASASKQANVIPRNFADIGDASTIQTRLPLSLNNLFRRSIKRKKTMRAYA